MRTYLKRALYYLLPKEGGCIGHFETRAAAEAFAVKYPDRKMRIKEMWFPAGYVEDEDDEKETRP